MNDFQGWVNSKLSIVVVDGIVKITNDGDTIGLISLQDFKAIHTILFLRGLI